MSSLAQRSSAPRRAVAGGEESSTRGCAPTCSVEKCESGSTAPAYGMPHPTGSYEKITERSARKSAFRCGSGELTVARTSGCGASLSSRGVAYSAAEQHATSADIAAARASSDDADDVAHEVVTAFRVGEHAEPRRKVGLQHAADQALGEERVGGERAAGRGGGGGGRGGRRRPRTAGGGRRRRRHLRATRASGGSARWSRSGTPRAPPPRARGAARSRRRAARRSARAARRAPLVARAARAHLVGRKRLDVNERAHRQRVVPRVQVPHSGVDLQPREVDRLTDLLAPRRVDAAAAALPGAAGDAAPAPDTSCAGPVGLSARPSCRARRSARRRAPSRPRARRAARRRRGGACASRPRRSRQRATATRAGADHTRSWKSGFASWIVRNATWSGLSSALPGMSCSPRSVGALRRAAASPPPAGRPAPRPRRRVRRARRAAGRLRRHVVVVRGGVLVVVGVVELPSLIIRCASRARLIARIGPYLMPIERRISALGERRLLEHGERDVLAPHLPRPTVEARVLEEGHLRVCVDLRQRCSRVARWREIARGWRRKSSHD